MSGKILVAPSAYKGTLLVNQVSDAIADGIRKVLPETIIVSAPIADGGDGTLDAIGSAVGGCLHQVTVQGALSQPVHACWLELDRLAIVELASASGLGVLDQAKLRPLDAHTFGTGQVISECLHSGFKNIVVCVGGSASTDGGSGLLAALGAKFYGADGAPLSLGGGALQRLDHCDLSALQKGHDVSCKIATDVLSPLTGEHGAAHVFAPQKGADENDVLLLDRALTRFADVLESACNMDVRNVPGAGAAGGTAFGLACAMGARIVHGFSWLSALIDLEEKIAGCDLVITAEGRLDRQSLVGKATGELARLCRKYGKPLWAVPALAERNVDWTNYGIERVQCTADGRMANSESISRAVVSLLERHRST